MALFTITDNGHLPFSDIESVLTHREVEAITATAETGMFLIDDTMETEPDFTYNYKLDGSWLLGELPFRIGTDIIPYQGFVSGGVSNLDCTFSQTQNYRLDGTWQLGELPFVSGSVKPIVTITSKSGLPYTFMGLNIDFDAFNNDYPVEFDVEFHVDDAGVTWNYALDGSWKLGEKPFSVKNSTLIDKEEVAGSQSANYRLSKQVNNVHNIKLIFKKTFNLNRRIRITDIVPIIAAR